MVEYQRFGPKVMHRRSFKRDPNRAEWVEDDLPTKTVKKGLSFISASAEDLVGSHTVSGTATMRLTYANMTTTQASGTYHLFMADRDGTFDHLILGESNRSNITLMGDGNSPIHTVKGSFSIRTNTAISSGTVGVSFEGIES